MYRIVFLGLVNFFELDEPQGRLVLVPDGRNPPADIDPGDKIDSHRASFFIQEEDILDRSKWWPNREDQEVEALGVRELGIEEPSQIAISGMEPKPVSRTRRTSGSRRATKKEEAFDDSEFEEKLVRLRDINGDILIEPEVARTIAQIPIRRGKLASRFIGGAIVAQLKVASHTGPITITATLDDGSGTKTLVLHEGAEIVLANISENIRPSSDDPEASHFRIYAQLDTHHRADLLPGPSDEEIEGLELDPIDTAHRFVQRLIDDVSVTPDGQCSITGCCRCASQGH
ncbi:MAG TPA: hypothetical protein VF432_26905 [Thermoanaerobaculia bacterium]